MRTDHGFYRETFADRALPLAFLDLNALDRNIEAIRDRAAGVPVRVASKSVRCRWILEEVLAYEGFEGLLCYSGHEAALLADHRFDDMLVAYPVTDRDELATVADTVADGADVTLTVDATEHVERVAEAARAAGTIVPVCIDLDVSTRHFGIHFGVRRSPVRSPEAAVDLARTVSNTDGITLRGVMGYEGQIAGLPDRDPSNHAAVNATIRLLKRRSRPRVRERRVATVEALRDAGIDVPLVNGGGTGSLESTTDDPSVTEVTVGSGLYAPRLFDFYDDFQHEPAAGYAVEVTRRPDPEIYTCRGGGYVASGPPGEDKIPAPYVPADAELLDTEAAGEVQTPVHCDEDLRLGDPVVMRHAKAGELCRTFDELHLLREGVVDVVPTYRGDGRWFL